MSKLEPSVMRAPSLKTIRPAHVAGQGAELGHRVGDVHAYCLLRDEQAVADLAVGVTLGDQLQDSLLAGRQIPGSRRGASCRLAPGRSLRIGPRSTRAAPASTLISIRSTAAPMVTATS